MKDKVLLIFEDTKNIKKLKKSLIDNNYLVSLCEINIQKIVKSIKSLEQDVLVFYYKKVDHEIIEIVKAIQGCSPIPIVIFADDTDTEFVAVTITSGASAFIVDGIESNRISHILEAAKARFKKCQLLKTQLEIAKSRIDMNINIDRATALLMKNNSLTAEDAYTSLKNMAEKQKLPIDELSKNVIVASELLFQTSNGL